MCGSRNFKRGRGGGGGQWQFSSKGGKWEEVQILGAIPGAICMRNKQNLL